MSKKKLWGGAAIVIGLAVFFSKAQAWEKSRSDAGIVANALLSSSIKDQVALFGRDVVFVSKVDVEEYEGFATITLRGPSVETVDGVYRDEEVLTISEEGGLAGHLNPNYVAQIAKIEHR